MPFAYTLLLPAVWNLDVMAGQQHTFSDHEVTQRMEPKAEKEEMVKESRSLVTMEPPVESWTD